MGGGGSPPLASLIRFVVHSGHGVGIFILAHSTTVCPDMAVLIDAFALRSATAVSSVFCFRFLLCFRPRPMVYSCSWPDYERSLSIPVDFGLVAEHCNSWRAFWDVQAGQYASDQSHRYDCVNGAMEFWASGSTMAAEAFSAACPGDVRAHPRPVDHAAMVAAAGPGSFNDADMLPIGCTFSMNGAGKKVPATAFTLDQANSVRHFPAQFPPF